MKCSARVPSRQTLTPATDFSGSCPAIRPLRYWPPPNVTPKATSDAATPSAPDVETSRSHQTHRPSIRPAAGAGRTMSRHLLEPSECGRRTRRAAALLPKTRPAEPPPNGARRPGRLGGFARASPTEPTRSVATVPDGYDHYRSPCPSNRRGGPDCFPDRWLSTWPVSPTWPCEGPPPDHLAS